MNVAISVITATIAMRSAEFIEVGSRWASRRGGKRSDQGRAFYERPA